MEKLGPDQGSPPHARGAGLSTCRSKDQEPGFYSLTVGRLVYAGWPRARSGRLATLPQPPASADRTPGFQDGGPCPIRLFGSERSQYEAFVNLAGEILACRSGFTKPCLEFGELAEGSSVVALLVERQNRDGEALHVDAAHATAGAGRPASNTDVIGVRQDARYEPRVELHAVDAYELQPWLKRDADLLGGGYSSNELLASYRDENVAMTDERRGFVVH